MKKINFLFSLLMLMAFSVGNVWGTDYELVYTLDGSITTGGNSAYASDGDGLTQSDIEWSVTGNTTMNPWRIGGKSLNGVDREVYSKTAIEDNVAKIEIEHGTASGITVNSVTIVVASDDAFTEVITTLTPDFVANDVMTVTRTEGEDWSNAYYKITYNVTVSGSSNKFVQLKSIKFYTGDAAAPAPSISVVDSETYEAMSEINFGDVACSWSKSFTFAFDYANLTPGTLTMSVPDEFHVGNSELQETTFNITGTSGRINLASIFKNTDEAGEISDYVTFTGCGLPTDGVKIPLKMNVKAPVVAFKRGSTTLSHLSYGPYYRYSFNNIAYDTITLVGQYLPQYQEMMLKSNAGFHFDICALETNYNHIYTNDDGTIDMQVLVKIYTSASVGTNQYINDDPDEGAYMVWFEDTWGTGQKLATLTCESEILSSYAVRAHCEYEEGEMRVTVYDSNDKIQDKTISNFDISGYAHSDEDLVVITATPAVGYEFDGWGYSEDAAYIDVISELPGQLRIKASRAVYISAGFTQSCTPIAAPVEVAKPQSEWSSTAYAVTFNWSQVEQGASGINASKFQLVIHPVDAGESTSSDIVRTVITNPNDASNVHVEYLPGGKEYTYTVMAIGTGDYCEDNNIMEGSSFETPAYPLVTLMLYENGDEHSFSNTLRYGDEITLPSTSSAGCSDKVLAGWSIISNASQTSQINYAPGATYTVFSTTPLPLYAVYAEYSEEWQLVSSIAANDIVVISTDTAYTGDMKTAGAISSQIMAALASTYNEDKSKITALAEGTLQFTVEGNATDGWMFKNGGKYLEITGDKKVNLRDYEETLNIEFDESVVTISKEIDENTYSLQFNAANPRFTAYKSTQTPISLYKQVKNYSNLSTTCNGYDGAMNVTFSLQEGTYNSAKTIFLGTTEGLIFYTLDGSTPTSNSTLYTDAGVALNEAGTYTIKAIAISANHHSDVTQATYTINLPLTTMDEIFARATAVGTTATDVTVTFDNWVVTGVKNKNAYVTDGTKGFIIYANNHGFQVGDVLSGTVACKVQIFNGSAELTNLTNQTTGLTVTSNGTITSVVLDEEGIEALSGVNTGAVITISGECSISNNRTYVHGVQLYTTLYTYDALEDGAAYTVTGVYLQYNTTKEILPRSAADIVSAKEDAGLVWSAETATAYTIGKAYELPTLSNENGVAVTYSSSAQGVATIDEEGVVSLVAAGETTIKATFAGDDTYAEAEVSYVLTVKAPTSLTISGDQTKTEFEFGDHFNPATDGEFVVKALYGSDDDYAVVTDVTWTLWSTAVAEYAIESNVAAAPLKATWNELTAQKNIVLVIKTHAITFAQPENGELVVKFNGSAIESGAEYPKTAQLTIEAIPATGYKLSAITINGEALEGTTFVLGTVNVVIAATFVENSDPTALDNVQVAPKAVKILRDGQLYILIGEKEYSIMGKKVK